MLGSLGFIKRSESKTWVHGPNTERAKIINKELGVKFPAHASAVTDTTRTPQGDLIWLGSVIPDHPVVKTKTKLVGPKETKERIEFVPKVVIDNVLEKRKDTLKIEKKSWFQGTR
tara:strand:+ start:631 stop:975 length:345 start_codon:yes stop_codon:yes gene_type:complete